MSLNVLGTKIKKWCCDKIANDIANISNKLNNLLTMFNKSYIIINKRISTIKMYAYFSALGTYYYN